MLLPLGGFALGVLVFLHLFLLSLGRFLRRFLVLLGCLFGLAAIFSDTPVFGLSVGRYRPGNARGGQYQESGYSFHRVSERTVLQRFYTEAGAGWRDQLGEVDQELSARRDKPDRNVAVATGELHNGEMGVGKVFIDFLERIAVGACAVFALLLVIRFGLPRRSGSAVTRRTRR
jgi:hypothetical protein